MAGRCSTLRTGSIPNYECHDCEECVGMQKTGGAKLSGDAKRDAKPWKDVKYQRGEGGL